MPFPLRSILPAVLFLLLFSFTSVSAGTTTEKTIVLHLQWLPQSQFAGYLVAREKGFYRDEGLGNVEIDFPSSVGDPLKTLLASECDFCCAWLPLAIRERSRGGELVELIQLFQNSSLIFIAHKESGVRTLQDLQGKRCQIWTNEIGDLPRLILKRNRIEPVAVPLGASQTLFLRKIVAAQVGTFYNDYNRIIESGIQPEELVVLTAGECGFDYPEDGLFCLRETLDKKPGMCAAFARASMRGWAYALDSRNEDEVLDIVVARAHAARNITNRNHQRWMLRAVKNHVTYRVGDDPAGWGKLSPEAYRKTVDMLREAGSISEATPFGDFFRSPLKMK